MTSSSESSYNLEHGSYFVDNSSTSLSLPEKKLLLAILERSILDYIGNDKKEAIEAGNWIFQQVEQPPEDDISKFGRFHNNEILREDYVFSFEGVCLQLDLDPSKIREIIRGMPKRGEKRVAPWFWGENGAQASVPAAT